MLIGDTVRGSLMALAALGLVGCSSGPGDQMAELNQARDRWAAQGIPTYVMTVRRGCFCAGPLAAEVKVGEVAIERTDLDTGQPVPPEFAALFPDIPGLFEMIRQEILRPAAALTVEYDALRGFPTSIVVDRIKNAVDDEYGYTISAFRIGQ